MPPSDTRDAWDSAAGGWARWEAVNTAYLAPATALMLDQAGVRAGSRVLDVACGAGEQSLAAAHRIGPTGHVLATDIAPAMVAAAQAAALAAGITTIETRVCAAAALEPDGTPFDAAICRLGLMLMPDPAAALRAIRAMLRPGGHLAAIVVGPEATNPFNAEPLAILRRHAGKPALPGAPGLFALADAAQLAALFRQAGFQAVTATPVASERRLPSAEAATAMIRDAFGFYRALIDDQPEVVRHAAWAEVTQALRRFEGPDGLRTPGELLVAAGQAPG